MQSSEFIKLLYFGSDLKEKQQQNLKENNFSPKNGFL